MKLYIGNKNYSSWSMRAWVLMRQLNISFDEVALRLDFAADSDFHRTVATVSPAGRVPVLVDAGLAVWDSLSIAEYLHEKFADRGVWPREARARARARSLCAEMHSGFTALRSACPMNIEASLPEVGQRIWSEQPAVRQDLARIEQMWAEALHDSGGSLLFGRFSAVDAFYAPICSRLRTYGLPVSTTARDYIERVSALPAVMEWNDAARREHDFLEDDEPYRQPPPKAATPD